MNHRQEEKKIAAKYYDFTEYKRPDGDLNLFVRSWNRRNEVIIGGEDNDWDTYCEGYRRAADALVIHLTQDDLSERRDYSRFWESVAYSILFLYRHYLELRIKKLFLVCEGKIENVNNVHSLLRLWEIFTERYKVFCREYNLDSEELSEDNLADMETAKKIITNFSEIDVSAQAFRYPVDKMGKVTVEPVQFDIVRLKNMFGWLGPFLDGWSDGIYECWQAELRNRHEGK